MAESSGLVRAVYETAPQPLRTMAGNLGDLALRVATPAVRWAGARLSTDPSRLQGEVPVTNVEIALESLDVAVQKGDGILGAHAARMAVQAVATAQLSPHVPESTTYELAERVTEHFARVPDGIIPECFVVARNGYRV